MKTPLLMLHGALGRASLFDPHLEAIHALDIPVMTLDFPGHDGYAYETPFSIDIFANFVFEKTAHLPALSIFGYSMGGYVALLLAHKYPGRVESIATLGTKFDWSPETAVREASRLVPEKIEEKVPAFAELLKSRFAPGDWKKVVNSTAEMMHSLGARPDLGEKELSGIHIPVFIGRGALDNMVGAEESQWAAGQLPNGEYWELEGVKHPIEQVQTEDLVVFLKNTILAL